MKIRFNGHDHDLPEPATVRTALDHFGIAGGAFAVALNLEFVPRDRYAETTLRDGDELEVVSPRQGG